MNGQELRQRVADTINAWVGSVRGDAKHIDILNVYNSYLPLARGYAVKINDQHCATTTSAAYIRAGIADWTGTECGVEEFVKIAKAKGIWVENDAHVPQIGDACVYDWQDGTDYAKTDNQGWSDHIGIVTATGNGEFTVTEGNMSGGKVGKRPMKVNGRYIRGFICPNFDEIARELTAREEAAKPTEAPQTNKPAEQSQAGEDILASLTDEQAWRLVEKANRHAATLKPSKYAETACEKGIKSGLFTDGDKDGLVDNPQAFLKRQEFATVLDRMGVYDK